MSVLVLLLSVGAACCLGFGFVLQQQAAAHAPLGDFLSPRLLLDLIRVPRWLGGIGLMVCGMALGAIALSQGEVTLVEPLLATNLLFALALSRRQTRQPLGRQGWAGLVLLAGGVTAFIVAGRPEGGAAVGGPFRQWLIIGVMLGLALLLTTYAKRSRLSAAPALLAVAAGLLYGVQDALTRISGQLFAKWLGRAVHLVAAVRGRAARRDRAPARAERLRDGAAADVPRRRSPPRSRWRGSRAGWGSWGIGCGWTRGRSRGRRRGWRGSSWGWCSSGCIPRCRAGPPGDAGELGGAGCVASAAEWRVRLSGECGLRGECG